MADLIQILKKAPAAPSTSSWSAVVERLRDYGATRAATRPAAGPATAVEARCEFCGVGIDDPHGHLVDLPNRALLCVCRPCYLLFTHDGAGGARFRAVPSRFVRLPESACVGEAWDALDIPIGLAFFFRNSTTGRLTAFYPSPAGATESELPVTAWDALAQTVPLLSTMASDVEALLIRRTTTRSVALIVPIDVCYELVGMIRVLWRGLQGGDELWQHVDEFFARAVGRSDECSALSCEPPR